MMSSAASTQTNDPSTETPPPAASGGTGPATADLRSGLIVFFVALPLCLGIATASGAPPLAGLIAGIVGGTVVALISGSSLSVAGPAAGLTVIVIDAIDRLGFQAFLLATMLAGALQVVLGLGRLGKLGHFVPNSVIRGMLAAIGMILVFKQLPHALGHAVGFDDDLAFREADGHNTFSELGHALSAVHPGALSAAALAGLAMFVWRDYRRLPLRRWMPRELVAVAVGLSCSLLFVGTDLQLSSAYRVSIPLLAEVGGLRGLWVAPDFGAFTNLETWTTALTLAVVASIESLLSVSATDRLDPLSRQTPPDRELVAQGMGNLTSGLIGGLPVTAVVVRSFANVQSGARSRWSSVFHGLLLLGATLAFSSWLNHVPLAALAVVLIVVGYKLTPPQLYIDTWKLGVDQFVPFVATVGFILFTDLLTGTLCGIGFAIFFTMARHYQTAVIVTDDGPYRLIRFVSHVSFLHKARLRHALASMPAGGHVIVDGTRAVAIDPDVIEAIAELEQQLKPRGVLLSIQRSPTARHHYFRREDAAA